MAQGHTHKFLTLVRNPIPINMVPIPQLIRLRRRSLDRHIPLTHDRLAHIVETVIRMLQAARGHRFQIDTACEVADAAEESRIRSGPFSGEGGCSKRGSLLIMIVCVGTGDVGC